MQTCKHCRRCLYILCVSLSKATEKSMLIYYLKRLITLVSNQNLSRSSFSKGRISCLFLSRIRENWLYLIYWLLVWQSETFHLGLFKAVFLLFFLHFIHINQVMEIIIWRLVIIICSPSLNDCLSKVPKSLFWDVFRDYSRFHYFIPLIFL